MDATNEMQVTAGDWVFTNTNNGSWEMGISETLSNMTAGGNTAIGTGDYQLGHYHYVDYWQPYMWPTYPQPSITYIQEQQDKGKKAIEMADMLIKKELVTVKSAKQLMELLDELMKII